MKNKGDKKNILMNFIHQESQQQEFMTLCKKQGWTYSQFFTRSARRYTPKTLTSKERKRQVLSDIDEFYFSGTLPSYVIRRLHEIVAVEIQNRNTHQSVRSKPLQYLRPSYTVVHW